MSSIIKAPGSPNVKSNVDEKNYYIWKCGFKAGEEWAIEKAINWFRENRDEIVTSSFDEFKIKFREAMEE